MEKMEKITLYDVVVAVEYFNKFKGVEISQFARKKIEHWKLTLFVHFEWLKKIEPWTD